MNPLEAWDCRSLPVPGVSRKGYTTVTMQVKHEWVREEILQNMSGLEPDAPLPQERELAERYQVSRSTVRQALKNLATEGRIYAVRGRGTFVASQRISKDSRLTSFTEDMIARGQRPGTRLLQVEQVPAAPEIAAKLELESGSAILHLERLRLADGFPMCFEEIWLPAHMYPGLQHQDLERPLYGVFAASYNLRIDRAEQQISAQILKGRIADLLNVPPGSAALVVVRRSSDEKGRIAEYAKSIYRADRYDFQLTVSRSG